MKFKAGGLADAFGTLTDIGRAQARLLGERLSALPLDVVWHSPLPRARATAEKITAHPPGVPVASADELIDSGGDRRAGTRDPAVLAVPTATTALIQGRTVEVDGNTGRVVPQ